MSQTLSLLLVDADPDGLETLTYGFEREGSSVNATSDLMAAPKLVGAAAPSLVVVILRPPEPAALEVIRLMRTGGHAIPHVAVLALGPPERKAEARTAGASDFLATPTFIRDVVNAGKLAMLGRRASGQDAPLTQARLSDYHGLYYLLRAMAAAQSSALLRLERGNRRAELRVSEGRLLSATVEALQGLPALHHVLLWEEAGLSLKLGPVPKRSQLNLLAQEVLDESERFLRDFAHAARDLGPSSTVFVPVATSTGVTPGLQTSQAAPLLRLCDGHRILADVIAESPFRIFDTVRMIKRLRDSGALAARPPEPEREPRAAHNGAPRSMLAEWAMVPDLRGVVGDRRRPNRPSRPVAPVATPGPTPLPLVNKKGVATAGEGVAAAGEIIPRRRPTPAPIDLAVAPTIQVKLDAHGVPLSAPTALAPAAPAPLTVGRGPGQPTPIPLRTRSDQAARARLDHTPLPELNRPRPISQRQLEQTPPPQVMRAPTGPQSTLGVTPPPQVMRAPTGPQPTLDATPPPQVTRAPTGPEPTLDDPPPPQVMRAPTGPQPTLDDPPPPQVMRAPTGPQPTLDDPPPPQVMRAPTGPQPTLDDAPPPQAKRSQSGPQPKLDRTPAPQTKRSQSGPQPRLDRTPAPRVNKPASGPQQTLATTFDDVESDFFAREADLYKREAVETFDDLDHPLGRPSAKPRTRKK